MGIVPPYEPQQRSRSIIDAVVLLFHGDGSIKIGSRPNQTYITASHVNNGTLDYKTMDVLLISACDAGDFGGVARAFVSRHNISYVIAADTRVQNNLSPDYNSVQPKAVPHTYDPINVGFIVFSLNRTGNLTFFG